MIGGFLASWYCCHKRRIPLLQWADVSAPSVVLGTGITRIGCFLFGCDYGGRTSLPWAVRFPGPNALSAHGSPAWQHHVSRYGLPHDAAWSFPVHPTQIYESLVGLALFGLLMLVRRHRKFSGQVFLAWVFGYGIMRPLIETVRDDDDRGVYGVLGLHLSTSQIIGIVSVVLGLGLLVGLLRRYRRDPREPAALGAADRSCPGSAGAQRGQTTQTAVMATQGRAPVAALGGLVMLLGGAVHAAEPAKPRPVSAPAAAAPTGSPAAASPAAAPAGASPAGAAPAPSPAASPADAVARAEAQAGAAQRAAQDLEAQVIELRRTLQALERQRASFDDIRRRLDELDGRLAENERQDAARHRRRGARGGGDPVPRRRVRHPLPRRSLPAPSPPAPAGPLSGGVGRAGTGRRIQSQHLRLLVAARRDHLRRARRVVPVRVPVADRLRRVADAQRRLRAVAIPAQPGGPRRAVQGSLRAPAADLDGRAGVHRISSAMAAFSLGRDLGLMLVGAPLASRLQYELAITNGSGTGQPNDNVNLAYTARLVAAPFGPLPPSEGDLEWHAQPLVSGGIAGTYNLRRTDIRLHDPTASINVDGNDKIDNIAFWQGGVQLRALWRGAALQAEGFGRLQRPGAAGPDRKFWGGYIQASYFIIPHRLQVAGRVARSDQPTYGVPNAELVLHGTVVDEQEVAVSTYLHGHHAKLQVDYAHLRSEDATSTPNAHRVRAAIQLWF